MSNLSDGLNFPNDFPGEHSFMSAPAEVSIVDQAVMKQAQHDVVLRTLRRLMRTQIYAYSMSSMDSACLPPNLKAVRDIADELEFRRRELREEIKGLFELPTQDEI